MPVYRTRRTGWLPIWIFFAVNANGGGRTAGPTQDMNDVLTFMLEKNQTYTVKYANEAGKMKEVEVKLGEQPVELKLYMK